MKDGKVYNTNAIAKISSSPPRPMPINVGAAIPASGSSGWGVESIPPIGGCVGEFVGVLVGFGVLVALEVGVGVGDDVGVLVGVPVGVGVESVNANLVQDPYSQGVGCGVSRKASGWVVGAVGATGSPLKL